jgi:hypothetical protein
VKPTYVKLVPYAEEILGEYRGFLGGRSTADHTFNVGQILEIFWKWNTDVYLLFIDFQAA